MVYMNTAQSSNRMIVKTINTLFDRGRNAVGPTRRRALSRSHSRSHPPASRGWADPILSAGPAHLGDFVSDFAMIPAEPPRDLVYRDATNEHLAQRVHLRIRPLSAGIHGQRFVICLGPPRIED